MKTNLIAAIVVLAVTTVAQGEGFFAPQEAPFNPLARVCTLKITWVVGSPAVVERAFVSSPGTTKCEEEKVAAMASAFNDMLNPAPAVGL